ncbi:MAG: hypothetical protein KatS3mg126_2533 [Lysobacteraceae bacterium]|nr:MAG: hypothetical protein KatS3mg126_2533 [Xanthomonadaceae bacterium]
MSKSDSKPRSARRQDAGGADPALRAAVLRIALLVLAGALAISGLGLVAIGMHGLRAEPVGVDLVAQRDELARKLAAELGQLGQELERRIQDPYFRADVEAGALEAAAERLGRNWPGIAAASVHPPQVERQLEEGAGADYGRLALQARAKVEDGVAVAPVGSRSEPRIGLARRVDDGDGTTIAVAMVEVPMALITDPIRSTAIGAALLELRAGGEHLYAYGDESLRAVAVPVRIEGTPFQLALGRRAQMFGDSPLLPLGLGALLAVLAVGAFGLARRVGASAPAFAEPTFAEALAAEQAEAALKAVDAQEAAPAEVEAARPPAPPKAPLRMDRSIFRAYDIRGVVGETLDADVARLIGQAIGSSLREQGLREIVVGRDGRRSGPELARALIEGLRSTGCDVTDLGMVPTPVVYFASHQLGGGSGVAVTGSHNPPQYNGFKIMIGGRTLSGEDIVGLYERIAEDRLQRDEPGGLQELDIRRDYIDRIAGDVALERPLQVVVDCGNGVAGEIAPAVLEAVGASVEGLFCEVDGSFPNHHPDPSDPDNLSDLITVVKQTGADLGLAFDGDGDRLGVVTRSGRIIHPDRVLMLFAQDVLSRNPGAAVIYDVKCSGHLAAHILRHGGSPIMWKTGHSLIKAKMAESGAELAGEMSGHFFFGERWYGFDDGIYAAARLLEILAADERDPEEVFAELPDSVSTPEIKVPMEESRLHGFMERFREKAQFEGAKIVTIDGVRADWPDGWGLVRRSNTTPCLVLRFDADDAQALARIQETFRAQLLALEPGLNLPF